MATREASGRSASHPATLRRPATPGAARRTAPPQSGRLTGRAAALGLVVLALMLAYAYPVRLYLDQQAQIQQLELAQAAQRLRIGALKAETDKWSDPAYVAAQVGARFQMVKPGQKTVYIVLPPPDDPAKSGKNASNNDSTWYGAMWNAIAGAGGGS